MTAEHKRPQRYIPALLMRRTEDGTTHLAVGCKPIAKMVDIEDGDYVLYSDFEKLETRIAELEQLVDNAQAREKRWNDRLDEANKQLAAMTEDLLKAKDHPPCN
jgi:hypothetical protein